MNLKNIDSKKLRFELELKGIVENTILFNIENILETITPRKIEKVTPSLYIIGEVKKGGVL